MGIMSFKIRTGDGATTSFIAENLSNLRSVFVYVQRGKSFVDFCAFDDNHGSTKVFGYKEIQFHEKAFPKNRIDSTSDWGIGLFSINTMIRNRHKCHNRFCKQKNNLECQTHRLDSQNREIRIESDYFIKINLEAHLCDEVVRTCRKSNVFLRNFQRYAKSVNPVRRSKKKEGAGEIVTIGFPLLFLIKLTDPRKECLQLKWDERIQRLVAKRGYMEDAMSWLNTLGGGYSALGDYFTHHAKEAGRISLRQMKVALEMGDPPTIIRCHLYFGLSLMQCGQLRRAKYIIRHQYRRAKKIAATDHRLEASCFGLWSRLSYLYHQRYLALHQKI